MLTVPVEIRKSAIHGYGVFARDHIPKGKVVWMFAPGLDIVRSVFALEQADPRTRDFIMERGFINPKKPDEAVICADESQFCNFPLPGEKANTELGNLIDGQYLLLAAQDIVAGTEITVPPDSDADYARKMESR